MPIATNVLNLYLIVSEIKSFESTRPRFKHVFVAQVPLKTLIYNSPIKTTCLLVYSNMLLILLLNTEPQWRSVNPARKHQRSRLTAPVMQPICQSGDNGISPHSKQRTKFAAYLDNVQQVHLSDRGDSLSPSDTDIMWQRWRKRHNPRILVFLQYNIRVYLHFMGIFVWSLLKLPF